MLTISERAIPADSEKLKSITLLKIGPEGSLSCSWYPNPDRKLAAFPWNSNQHTIFDWPDVFKYVLHINMHLYAQESRWSEN